MYVLLIFSIRDRSYTGWYIVSEEWKNLPLFRQMTVLYSLSIMISGWIVCLSSFHLQSVVAWILSCFQLSPKYRANQDKCHLTVCSVCLVSGCCTHWYSKPA